MNIPTRLKHSFYHFFNEFRQHPIKGCWSFIKYLFVCYVIYVAAILILMIFVGIPLSYFYLNPRVIKDKVISDDYEVVEYISYMGLWDCCLYWHLKFPVGGNPIPKDATWHIYKNKQNLNGYYYCFSDTSAIPDSGTEYTIEQSGKGYAGTTVINYIFNEATGDLYVEYVHD